MSYDSKRRNPKPSKRQDKIAQDISIEGSMKNTSKVDYNILAHLKKIPALLSVYDALMLSKELREAFIKALHTSETYEAHLAEVHITQTSNFEKLEQITFTKDDLMLGSLFHNRPLYVTGKFDQILVKRILIDPGAAVNLLPLYTLQKIGYNEYDLKSENVVVCGFNQSSQAVVGSISLVLHLDDFKTIVKFHVIDADTSYKAMLGRPWIHRNGVVPSTLHQCLKYIEDGIEKRIIGDLKPFTYKEAHYSNAKFFLNEREPSKIYLKEIESQNPKVPQMNRQVKLEAEKAKSGTPVSAKSKTTWKPKTQNQAFKALHLGSDSEEEEEKSSKGKVKITKMIPAGLTTPSVDDPPARRDFRGLESPPDFSGKSGNRG